MLPFHPGTIVGYIIFAGVSKAFQYKNGVVTDLGAVAGMPITGAASIRNRIMVFLIR